MYARQAASSLALRLVNSLSSYACCFSTEFILHKPHVLPKAYKARRLQLWLCRICTGSPQEQSLWCMTHWPDPAHPP